MTTWHRCARRARLGVVLLLLAITFGAVLAEADEVRPGYLEIEALGADALQLLWKVPTKGGRMTPLELHLPDACSERSEPNVTEVAGAVLIRHLLVCPDGPAGNRIRIDGLGRTRTDVLVRYLRADGSEQVVRLGPGVESFELAEGSTWLEIALLYTGLGIEHILLGFDHLLFVLALLLLVRDLRTLLWAVTAFTVAHSITLAGATLGLLYLPGPPVEAVIALSILFLASEVLHAQRGRPGLAQRSPWVVAFAFGLLHGFGFAGALAEVGLPDHAIPLALLFFNVGVEIGQLLFVAACVVLARLGGPLLGAVGGARGQAVLCYGIGGLAAFWTVERVAGFWG